MMTTERMAAVEHSDVALVSESLSGNRDAFGQIVARYQSLICSLAYSATGSLSQSEDLAQETFVAAWKQLAELREPSKLRSWLCGIARNRIGKALRRDGREPAHAAEPLEALTETHAPEPLPVEQTISNEEAAILWRSLERIPETYREPLVLFYREHQSVEKVAEALELSQDAVKQRLSRGRKLLHEQVLAFVEGALERTNPGRAFTMGVMAALPAFTISAKAAVLGATAAKGSVAAKGAAATGLASAILSPVLIFLGSYFGYRMGLDGAQSDRERQYIKRLYRRLLACILGFSVASLLIGLWARGNAQQHPLLMTSLIIGLAVVYTLAVGLLVIWSQRARRKLAAETAARGADAIAGRPPLEYRSKWTLLGLPLVHIRVRGCMYVQHKPVLAWFAAGDNAIGLLFAFGGMAIAPFSIGGFAVGLLPFGGFAVGPLAFGGFSVGIWSLGGCAVGWQAFGGCAIAWSAAIGGWAIAHDFALGGFAHAAQANNELAGQFIRPAPFFQYGLIVMRHAVWLNLVWVIPMLLWWRAVRRGRRRQENGNH